jgi:glucose-1-phosphate thymidylyltransferase
LLVVRSNERDGPSAYNEVVVGADGRVTAFREKPLAPVSPLAAIALYFFPADVAGRIDEYLEAGGNRDAPGHFIAWLVGKTNVRAEPIPGVWFDIGSLEGLAIARDRFRPNR